MRGFRGKCLKVESFFKEKGFKILFDEDMFGRGEKEIYFGKGKSIIKV